MTRRNETHDSSAAQAFARSAGPARATAGPVARELRDPQILSEAVASSRA
jgi:hypothetical protein